MDFRKSTGLGKMYTFSTLASGRIMAGLAPKRDREYSIGDERRARNEGAWITYSQQAEAQIGNGSVVHRATVNNRPFSHELWLELGGLLGGIGLAFVIEFLDDRLKSESDVHRYIGLTVIAKVPQLD